MGRKTGMKARPAHPNKLRFSIGGVGPWIEVEWQSARLIYREGFMLEAPHTILETTPSDRKWLYFWRALDKADVWAWLPDCTKEMVDGTGWELELEHEGKGVISTGSNDYPGGEGKGSRFEIVLRALQRLTGQRGIR